MPPARTASPAAFVPSRRAACLHGSSRGLYPVQHRHPIISLYLPPLWLGPLAIRVHDPHYRPMDLLLKDSALRGGTPRVVRPGRAGGRSDSDIGSVIVAVVRRVLDFGANEILHLTEHFRPLRPPGCRRTILRCSPEHGSAFVRSEARGHLTRCPVAQGRLVLHLQWGICGNHRLLPLLASNGSGNCPTCISSRKSCSSSGSEYRFTTGPNPFSRPSLEMISSA